MAESVKRNLIPTLVTAFCGLLVYLVILSFQAGALENRVTAVEKAQATSSAKIDELLKVSYEIRVEVARLGAEQGKR